MNTNLATFTKNYFKNIESAFNGVDFSQVENLCELILETHKKKAKLILAGNGGSSLNATHFCMGMSLITRRWKDPFRCVSLSDNAAYLTSLSNDFEFETSFEKLLVTMAHDGDSLVLISSSGKSQNLINTALKAKDLGLNIFGILGGDGGEVLSLCNNFILIPSSNQMPGFTEDVHMVIIHALTEYMASYQG